MMLVAADGTCVTLHICTVVVSYYLLLITCAVARLCCVSRTGDVFDRGHNDLEIEEWLYRWQEEAQAAGGAVHCLLGNHEVFNAKGDHSMAARAAFAPFNDLKPECVQVL
eukprot:15366-Heterococcus_DN1.PRE.1